MNCGEPGIASSPNQSTPSASKMKVSMCLATRRNSSGNMSWGMVGELTRLNEGKGLIGCDIH